MGIALFSLPPGIVHRDYVGGVLPVQVRPTEWLPLDHTGHAHAHAACATAVIRSLSCVIYCFMCAFHTLWFLYAPSPCVVLYLLSVVICRRLILYRIPTWSAVDRCLRLRSRVV